jgi:hypothetical protein
MSSSVSDLVNQPAPLPRAARPDDRAKRPRDPPLAADHLADIVLGHVQAEHERVVTLLLLDANRLRVVDEALRQVGQQLSPGS